MRPVRAGANIDPDAIAHNCARLLGALDGSALCAVVKADGYGHGAVECAAVALRAGAGWLAVATVEEASELRDAGIEAPILIMGAIADRDEIEWAIELQADIVLWRERSVALASSAAEMVSGIARARGCGRGARGAARGGHDPLRHRRHPR
jgi:alanine racemase